MLSLWRDTDAGIRVVRLTRAEEVARLVRLFEVISTAENWQPDGALRRWVERSVYFAVEVDGRFAGGLQLVLPAPEQSLPCQGVWPEVPVEPPARSAHVAILALEEAHRGQGLLFWRAVVEMWRHCVGAGITSLYLEVTPRVLPLYRRLGWPLEIRGELRMHWGEPCYLCSLGVPEVAEALLRRAESSPYYREIISQAFRVAVTPRPAAASIVAV